MSFRHPNIFSRLPAAYSTLLVGTDTTSTRCLRKKRLMYIFTPEKTFYSEAKIYMSLII